MLAPVYITLHYQNDILHPDSPFRMGTSRADPHRDGVIAAANSLLQSARAHSVPIIHGRIAFSADHRELIANCPLFAKIEESRALVEGSWGAEFFEGLGPINDEMVITHTRNNLFFQTDLAARLDAIGAKTLIFSGVATSFSVEHTARHAVDMGYRVIIARDACTTGDRSLHDGSLKTLAVLAEIYTSDEIMNRFANHRLNE